MNIFAVVVLMVGCVFLGIHIGRDSRREARKAADVRREEEE